jgi:exopolysaccharide biosynthesis WecB/TagA/CpsF family protein
MPVSTESLSELIDRMLTDAPALRAAKVQPALVFDCNGHAVSLFARDAAYRANLLDADLIHADGQVIVAASRWLRGPAIADRSATTDLFIDSIDAAHTSGVRYFLLGGTEEVNAACAATVELRAPGLIVGRHHGYWRAQEEADVVAQINDARPDVVWVGLGKPSEQAFCVRRRDQLATGWLVTCGGLFNFVTGHYPRAPKWMQRAGLEWLHRLASNPRQLAWRYMTTNPHALWLIWKLRRNA